MDGLEPLEKQTTEDIVGLSIQDRATTPASETGLGFSFGMLASTGDLVPAWWSTTRDNFLSKTWQQCPLFAGAIHNIGGKLATIPPIIEPRDPTSRAQRKLAEEYSMILYEGAEFGVGYIEFATRWFLSRWVADNGAFAEILGNGPKDGPIVGSAKGLANLDDQKCLGRDSRILMADGSKLSILKIVREHIQGEVMSLLPDGSIGPRKITGWHETKLGNRKWLHIHLAHSRKTFGRHEGLWVTNDHQLLTDYGWVGADELQVGNRIVTHHPRPSAVQEQLLVGMMLGDAFIFKHKSCASLHLTHCTKQEEWLDLKISALKGFEWGPHYPTYRGTIQVITHATPGLNEWHSAWYDGRRVHLSGRKAIPRDLVDRTFSPLMLAAWYLDDGNIQRRAKWGRPSVRLYTNGFARDDVYWLSSLMNKHNYAHHVYMTVDNNGQEYFYIHLTPDGSELFWRDIAPYIPPSMRYKLPDGYAAFDKALWENISPAERFADEIISIEEGYKAGQTGAFCIDVDETHNFIADGMVVHNCTRTGNPIYPVIYQADTGKRYKLHYTRVIYSAQLPSNRDVMNGVGTSWFSRCIGVAQSIVDDLTFKQEKLGKRPKRAILVGRKMDVSMITSAFKIADESADNAGLSRVSMIPVIANPNAADVGIDLVDLASLPDGFEWQTDVNIAMYVIGLTGGFPVRWMWPATVVGATKADAMIQHMVGAMSGTAYEMNTLGLLLGGSERGFIHKKGKFLPAELKIRYEVQDDWIDSVQAEIRNVRSQYYEKNLADQSVTIRVTREQMLGQGEITEAQFRDMELGDGRTQDGLPIDTLFYGDNPFLQGIDPEEFNEEEVQSALETAKKASIQQNSQREEAREAVAALEWLLREQEKPQEGGVAEQTQNETPQGQGTAQTSGESTAPEEVVKAKGDRYEFEGDLSAELGDLLGGIEQEFVDDVDEGKQPDYDKFGALLFALLVGWLVKGFMDKTKELENEIGVSLDPAEWSALATAWATEYGRNLINDLTNTTKKVVDRALRVAENMTQEQIKALLDPAFSKTRADMIAITETTRAYTASIRAYRDMLKEKYGLDFELVVRTARDELVCESVCAPLDGKGEEVWATEYPEGSPFHGRCRCAMELRLRK